MPPTRLSTRSSTRASNRRVSTTPATPRQPPSTVAVENTGREGAGGSSVSSSRSHSPGPHIGEVNETGAASGSITQHSTHSDFPSVPPIRTADDVVASLPSEPLEGGEFIHKICELLTSRCGPHGEEISNLLQPILAIHPGFQPQDDEGFLCGTPSLLKDLDWGKNSNKIVSTLTKIPVFNTRWSILKAAINYLSGQNKYLGRDTTLSDLKLLSSARAKAVHEMSIIPRKSILHDRSSPMTAEDLSLKPLTQYEDLRDWVDQTESSFRKRGLTAYLSNPSHCKEHLVLSEAYSEQIRVSLKDGPLSSLVQDKSVSDTSVLFSTIKRELQSDKYRMVDQMKYWDDFFNLKLTDLGDTPAWKNKIETWVGKLTTLASEAVKDNTLIRAIILRSMQCKEHSEQKVAAYMDAQEDYKTLLEKVQTRYRTLTRIEGTSVNSAAGRTIRRGSTTPSSQPSSSDPSSKKRFNIPELPVDIDRILRDPERDLALLKRWRGHINQNRIDKPHQYYLFPDGEANAKRGGASRNARKERSSGSARSARSDHRHRDRSTSQRARHRNTRRSRSRDSLRSPSRDSYYDGDNPRTSRGDSPRPSQRRRTDE